MAKEQEVYMEKGKNIESGNQSERLKCFECKWWTAMVQESETPQETYTQIIRERNVAGQVLGACTAFKGAYPMFDTEKCKLNEEHVDVAERVGGVM